MVIEEISTIIEGVISQSKEIIATMVLVINEDTLTIEAIKEDVVVVVV